MRPWADTTCKVFACEPHYKLRPCQECSLSFHNFRNYSVCHPFVNLPNRLDHLQCIIQYVHLPLGELRGQKTVPRRSCGTEHK